MTETGNHFVFCFSATPCSAQSFCWVMPSGITPGSALRSLQDAQNGTEVGRMPNKHPLHCVFCS